MRISLRFLLVGSVCFCLSQIQAQTVRKTNLENCKDSLESKYCLLEYITKVWLNGKQTGSRTNQLLYFKQGQRISFCLFEKEDLIETVYVFKQNRVYVRSNNSLMYDTMSLDLCPVNFELHLLPEITNARNFSIQADKINSELKGKKIIETYYQHRFTFNSHGLESVETEFNRHTKNKWVQKIEDIKITRIDSLGFDSLQNLFIENVQVIHSDLSKNKLLIEHLNQLRLSNVLTNKVVDLDTGLTIVDFSFTSCGPCWKNFALLENTLSKFEIPVYIIDPNYTRSRDYNTVKAGISPFFTYCRIDKHAASFGKMVGVYPRLFILKGQQILYTHIGLLSEADLLHIKQVILSEF